MKSYVQDQPWTIHVENLENLNFQILINRHGSFLLLTVTGDDVNNQTLNTRDEFGIEIIVEECDGYLGRGRIAFDL